MKRMTDFKNQENSQIEKLVAEKREALRTSRFGSAGSRSRNVRENRETRKEIARALTELSARTKAAQAQALASKAQNA